MILFFSDWKKYPTAQADWDTKNKSFLKLATIYRLMGVKNHAFMLALINPRLKGVDPHDVENLTEEQKQWIGVECRLNPWYFFREVARAPAIAGTTVSMFEANRANISMLWCFFLHVFYILIQPRQTGKSYSVDTLMALLLNILCSNTQINLLTKDDTLRRETIDRIKSIIAELPPYLNQRSKQDSNNGEEITIRAMKNVYKSHVAQASEKAALKQGRGLTSPIFHIDEAPFQTWIKKALGAALGASGAAVDKAKLEGAPHGTIITTTAGKKDDKDGRFIYMLIQESAIWTERFLDAADEVELEHMVRTASRSNIVLKNLKNEDGSEKTGVFRISGTFSHRQLGKTDQWLREKLEASTQTGEDADRDYFNRWTSGNSANPLDLEILEAMVNHRRDIVHTDISSPHGYITRWYIEREKIFLRMNNGHNYIMAIDPSEAGGGDDIGLVIMDAQTFEVICAGNFNETNIIKFAEWVCSMIVTFPALFTIVERRSSGSSLLDYLLLMLPSKGIDPFKRLFNRIVQEASENRDRYSEIQVPMNRRSSDIYDRYSGAFGFPTSGSGTYSRSELYSSVLQVAAKRCCKKMNDATLINQVTGLITLNGRVDHPRGEHDDMVIAWLLINWVLTRGKNLMFYNIDITKVDLREEELTNASPQERWKQMEQRRIRARMEELMELIANENEEMLVKRYEYELRALDKKVILEAGEVYSVDELIRRAKEAKRNKRFNKQAQQNSQSFQSRYG